MDTERGGWSDYIPIAVLSGVSEQLLCTPLSWSSESRGIGRRAAGGDRRVDLHATTTMLSGAFKQLCCRAALMEQCAAGP